MAMAIDSNDEEPLFFTNYESTLHKSFIDMFQKEEFTDATLICDNKSVRIHKFLLSASSTFFNDIFKKYEGDRAHFINNIKYEDLMKVLEFIYNGEVQIYPSQFIPFIYATNKLRITINDDEIHKIATTLGLSMNEILSDHSAQNSECDHYVGDIKIDCNENTISIGLDKIDTIRLNNHTHENERNRERKKLNKNEKSHIVEVNQMEFIERMFKVRNLPWPTSSEMDLNQITQESAWPTNIKPQSSEKIRKTSNSKSVGAPKSSSNSKLVGASKLVNETESDTENDSVDSKNEFSVKKSKRRNRRRRRRNKKDVKRGISSDAIEQRQEKLNELEEQIKNGKHCTEKPKPQKQIIESQTHEPKQMMMREPEKGQTGNLTLSKDSNKNVPKTAQPTISKTGAISKTSRPESVIAPKPSTSKSQSVDTYDNGIESSGESETDESDSENEIASKKISNSKRKLRSRIHKIKQCIRNDIQNRTNLQNIQRRQKKLNKLEERMKKLKNAKHRTEIVKPQQQQNKNQTQMKKTELEKSQNQKLSLPKENNKNVPKSAQPPNIIARNFKAIWKTGAISKTSIPESVVAPKPSTSKSQSVDTYDNGIESSGESETDESDTENEIVSNKVSNPVRQLKNRIHKLKHRIKSDIKKGRLELIKQRRKQLNELEKQRKELKSMRAKNRAKQSKPRTTTKPKQEMTTTKLATKSQPTLKTNTTIPIWKRKNLQQKKKKTGKK